MWDWGLGTASCRETMAPAHDCDVFAFFPRRVPALGQFLQPADRPQLGPHGTSHSQPPRRRPRGGISHEKNISLERLAPQRAFFSAFWALRAPAKRCGELHREMEKATLSSLVERAGGEWRAANGGRGVRGMAGGDWWPGNGGQGMAGGGWRAGDGRRGMTGGDGGRDTAGGGFGKRGVVT